MTAWMINDCINIHALTVILYISWADIPVNFRWIWQASRLPAIAAAAASAVSHCSKFAFSPFYLILYFLVSRSNASRLQPKEPRPQTNLFQRIEFCPVFCSFFHNTQISIFHTFCHFTSKIFNHTLLRIYPSFIRTIWLLSHEYFWNVKKSFDGLDIEKSERCPQQRGSWDASGFKNINF